MRALVSLAMWAIGIAWMAPMMGLLMVLGAFVHPQRFDRLSRLYCRGQLFLAGVRWRAEVDPAVDPAVSYVFMQNHVNVLDHVTCYDATPHFKQGLELEEHFRIPIYGWFMRARGTIPVQRGSRGQSAAVLARIRAEIDSGRSILAFPEGTRTTNGTVGPFRRGVFFIARDLGIPVVPVAVAGMFAVQRKGSWHLHPGQDVVVFVGPPMATSGLSDEGVAALALAAQAWIAERVDGAPAARHVAVA